MGWRSELQDWGRIVGVIFILALHLFVFAGVAANASDAAITFLVVTEILVFGTSFWVFFDSITNHVCTATFGRTQGIVSNDIPYEKMMGLNWFLGCLLLWILFFPIYLSQRSKQLQSRKRESHSTINVATDSAEELRKFKKLLDDGVITQDEWITKKQELLGHR